MANPDPEITPPDAKAVRPDAIVATGRSDYPNQVNNVLGFPFIFRGALDVRATAINEEMKIAAANAIAELAREQVPEEVAAAYGKNHQFGRDYIIPAPFDPRLMEVVSSAVAKAAMDSGVAQKPIEDFDAYRHSLKSPAQPDHLGADASLRAGEGQSQAGDLCRGGERGRAARGDPVPRFRLWRARCWSAAPRRCSTSWPSWASAIPTSFEIHNSAEIAACRRRWSTMLYDRLQRRGFIERDVRRHGQPGSQHLRLRAAQAGRRRCA